MNCQEVMEFMQRQLDDDLDESEREVLMNHTRHCPDCAAMFERLKLLSAELTSLPKVVPSYSLVDAIMPQLERIELFGQPEAATELSSPSIVESAETSRRVKRGRRWPSLRVMSGVIAAGIVAGLFLVTYKSGIAPDFASSNSAANESASAMDKADDTPEFALKSTAQESAVTPEVSTEAADDKATDDGAPKLENRAGSTNKPEAASSNSDSGADNHAPASGSTEDEDGIASGGGSNSSEGSAGSFGANTEAADTKQNTMAESENTAAEPGLLSPDGKLSAHAEDYSIKVYTMADQTLLLESPRKNGKLTNLVWSKDSTQLTYEVHVEKGAIETYVFDLTNGQEKKAAH